MRRRRNPRLAPGHMIALAAVGAGVLWFGTPAGQQLTSAISNSSLIRGRSGGAAKQDKKQKPNSSAPSAGSTTLPVQRILGPQHGGNNPKGNDNQEEPTNTPAPDGGPSRVIRVNDSVIKAGGLYMVLDFWADRFDFPVGDTVTLYGKMVFKDGDGNEYPLRGNDIDILDPDANHAKLFTVTTDSNGEFKAPYQGAETVKYRLYAYSSGVILTGLLGGQYVVVGPYQSDALEFRPYGSAIQLSGPEAQQQYHYLYQDYNAMASAWNDYSQEVDAARPDRTQGFRDHWEKVAQAIQELESGSQPLVDSRYQALRQWASWWNNDIYNTWLSLR